MAKLNISLKTRNQTGITIITVLVILANVNTITGINNGDKVLDAGDMPILLENSRLL